MSNFNRLQIYYAPLPEEKDEESSAAKEHAYRAKSMLEAQTGIKASIQQYQQLSYFDNKNDASDDSLFLIIIISCSADGSIHRSIRKTTKAMVSQIAVEDQDGSDMSTTKEGNEIKNKGPSFVVILLGHARCENSANQMNQTIYGAGRRIERSFSNIFTKHQDKLETQVELVGPEEEFDPYLESLIVRNDS